MENPRVLILNSSSIYGGGEYFVLNTAKGLIELGFAVLIGCFPGGTLYNKCKTNEIDAVEIDFPERGSAGLRKNIDTIRDLIKTFRADIIHTNTNYDRTAGAYAARKTKAKHVTSCHSLEPIGHNITHYLRNRFLTSHFICDGKSIQELITRKSSIPMDKTTVVHNGIYRADYARDNKARKKIRSEFGIEDNEIVIGNTGRLVPFKGHNYLLKAFKVVMSECFDIKLVIVGDGELENELKEETKILNLSGKVIFAGFRDDLKDVYSAFDIYAHSSLSGGGELFPFSILYAMAQPLPVVATGVGDIAEMISEGVNGFLVNEKSPYRFAQKLIQLTRDEQLRMRLGIEGERLLVEKFSFEKMVEKITVIYRKIMY